MRVRSILIRSGAVAAIAAIAMLAFSTMGTAHKADAAAVQPSCTFTTPIVTLIQQGGGADTATCTLTIHDTSHTLVIDFTVTPGAHPPVAVDSCTLDGNAIHVGPCP